MTVTQTPGVLVDILAMYGLVAVEFYERQMGYRNRSYPARLNDGRLANLIVYKSDADILLRIRNANYVGNYLATGGIPTRATLDPRIVTLRNPDRVTYAAVYGYLPGRTIPWEAYTQKHLKLLGWSLGRIHAELSVLARPAGMATATTEYLAILGRIQTYFAQPSVKLALQSKLGLVLDGHHLARFERLLEIYDNLPHRQILHLDFVRSNLLFGPAADSPEAKFQLGDVALTGVLDFEKTAFGHPAFDLARTLAFLLVDAKYKDESHIRKYFLGSGYAKRGRGHLPQPKLLEPLVTFFLTYDLYKFLRHNPYESLPQNEHFIRTRNLLINRLVLSAPSRTRFAHLPAKPLS